MELIEETLKLSPLYFTLSQEEVNELIQKLSARLVNTDNEDNKESTIN